MVVKTDGKPTISNPPQHLTPKQVQEFESVMAVLKDKVHGIIARGAMSWTGRISECEHNGMCWQLSLIRLPKED